MFRKVFEYLFAQPDPIAEMLVRIYAFDEEDVERCIFVTMGYVSLNLTANGIEISEIDLRIKQINADPQAKTKISRITIAVLELAELEVDVRVPLPIASEAPTTLHLGRGEETPLAIITHA